MLRASLSESLVIIMQPITIQVAVRVRKDYTPLHVYLGCLWLIIYVKYITYEGLLHNTLALDVDTVQEACIWQSAQGLYTLARLSGLCLGGTLCQIYYIRRPIT